MGVFSVEISLADQERQQWVDLSATVDTAAFMTSAPGALLREIGVIPNFTENFRMADGTRRTMDVGHAWLRLNGREVTTYIVFNDDYTTPLLGALALETLRLAIDPVEQRLIPLESLPL